MTHHTKYIFILGGVASSLGKGVASSALGALLQARSYNVRLRKFDPYLNVDPGTMSPSQHGEVFVTDDGAETDLDLGHYERFTGVSARKTDNVTTGKIYSSVIKKERRGDYLGKTVQVIPHVTDMIKECITQDEGKVDFSICEIGGTIGDIEGLPYIEAIRQLANELGEKRTLFILLTLLPYIPSAGELKTKPTQHAVKELLSLGIQPNIILLRSEYSIDEEIKKKVALFCNVPRPNIISALDTDTIYAVPDLYHQEGFDHQVLHHFNLNPDPVVDLSSCKKIVHTIRHSTDKITITIVGKYTSYLDSYKSLIEAITHGGIANNLQTDIRWIDAEDVTKETIKDLLGSSQALLVPGGFGQRGIEGKILTIEFARLHTIPIFMICLGMQLAVIEFAQHVAGISEAGSTEFSDPKNPVIGLMTQWQKEAVLHKRSKQDNLGGTMRLGAYPCDLMPDSKVSSIYGTSTISERHRHRYEVNNRYQDLLEEKGLKFSGLCPQGKLAEIIELEDHPWFIGVQFHPELKSRPFSPHPLFVDFIKTAYHYSQKNKK